MQYFMATNKKILFVYFEFTRLYNIKKVNWGNADRIDTDYRQCNNLLHESTFEARAASIETAIVEEHE